MSKAIRCDCCGRLTPDINPRYSRTKKFQWFRFDFDSQGGESLEEVVTRALSSGFLRNLNSPEYMDCKETARRLISLVRRHFTVKDEGTVRINRKMAERYLKSENSLGTASVRRDMEHELRRALGEE